MRRTVRSATITRSQRPSSISSSCLRPPPVRSAPAWSAEVSAEASSRSYSEAKGASLRPAYSRATTEPGTSSRSCRNGDRSAFGRARSETTHGVEQLESVRREDRRGSCGRDRRGYGHVGDARRRIPLCRHRRWVDGARARPEWRLRRRSREVSQGDEGAGRSRSEEHTSELQSL